MHKRSFLLSAAGAAIGPAAQATVGHASRALPPLQAPASAARWRSFLQQTFEMQANGRSVSAVLDRIDSMPGSAGTEQFVLSFHAAQPLASGLYDVVHGSGQRLSLYVSAQAPHQKAGVRLQAEFSLLTRAA